MKMKNLIIAGITAAMLCTSFAAAEEAAPAEEEEDVQVVRPHAEGGVVRVGRDQHELPRPRAEVAHAARVQVAVVQQHKGNGRFGGRFLFFLKNL